MLVVAQAMNPLWVKDGLSFNHTNLLITLFIHSRALGMAGSSVGQLVWTYMKCGEQSMNPDNVVDVVIPVADVGGFE